MYGILLFTRNLHKWINTLFIYLFIYLYYKSLKLLSNIGIQIITKHVENFNLSITIRALEIYSITFDIASRFKCVSKYTCDCIWLMNCFLDEFWYEVSQHVLFESTTERKVEWKIERKILSIFLTEAFEENFTEHWKFNLLMQESSQHDGTHSFQTLTLRIFCENFPLIFSHSILAKFFLFHRNFYI